MRQQYRRDQAERDAAEDFIDAARAEVLDGRDDECDAVARGVAQSGSATGS